VTEADALRVEWWQGVPQWKVANVVADLLDRVTALEEKQRRTEGD